MELVGNLVLQFFAWVILPVLLPIFIFSIILGLKSPDRLITEVFDTMLSVMSAVLKAAIAIFNTLLRLFFTSAKKSAGSGRPKSENGSGQRRFPVSRR